WANGGRAFTTMYLINFASWDKLSMPTLVHESTHVWQGVVAGPVYMVEALEAQLMGQGYNYGYTEDANGQDTGEGAQAELQAAGGDFSKFNREQQAQIIMHYYTRKFVPHFDPQHQPVTLDVSAWQPYANQVYRA